MSFDLEALEFNKILNKLSSFPVLFLEPGRSKILRGKLKYIFYAMQYIFYYIIDYIAYFNASGSPERN